MGFMQLTNGRQILDYTAPYFIAEVNSSHNGNLDTAKAMIAAAKDAGCDCVKFQSWSAESLYSASYYKQNPIAKRIVQKFALSLEGLKECAAFCKECGISFSSTPYSELEAEELVAIGAPFLKVASMEINNLGYLRFLAGLQVPLVLSTGMADMDEVKRAVDVLRQSGCKDLALLHCVSIYPAEPSTIHLNNIVMLRKEFPDCPIGFSDHTLGTEISVAATALGAAIIEKHLTLDKSKPGMDNNMAIEPDEISSLVTQCRHVAAALGSYERVVSDMEIEQRKKMRRSVIVVRDLQAGHILERCDLSVKRPGDGIPADKVDCLAGKRLLHDVQADTLLSPDDFI